MSEPKTYQKIYESDYAGGPNNFHVTRRGNTLDVELTYPPKTEKDAEPNPLYPHSRCRHIEIGLEDVRASDGIRLHYDFERDGWAIEQPTFADKEIEPGIWEEIETWHEVAFLQSWALEKETTEPDATHVIRKVGLKNVATCRVLDEADE